MAGGAIAVHGTTDTARTEAPVTIKTYLMCDFAAFGVKFFGYDTRWMGEVLGMAYFIMQYTNKELCAGITADNLPKDFAISASNKFWNCIIAVITPYLVSTDEANLDPKVFFVWGSTAMLSLTFAYFLVPETKGLSLEQVDKMLAKTPPRKSSRWVPHETCAAMEGLVDEGLGVEVGESQHAEKIV